MMNAPIHGQKSYDTTSLAGKVDEHNVLRMSSNLVLLLFYAKRVKSSNVIFIFLVYLFSFAKYVHITLVSIFGKKSIKFNFVKYHVL